MISFLSGSIIAKTSLFIILDVSGVGYQVFLSEKTLTKIPENSEGIKLFCSLHVRENTMDLYGFLTLQEMQLFELLNDISGIGPKAGLQMASIGSLEQFRRAVEQRNEEFFAGIHGIGRKKVQKIILELTGKLEKLDSTRRPEREEDAEVIDALVNLGFSRQRAREALEQVSQEGVGTEERIKEALKSVKR